MKAVGADQEVVAGGAAVGGAHGDGTAVVRYFGDRLAVADPCACLLGTLAEDGGEVGAVHAQGGWEIVTADKSSGRIEATDTTRWFGFTDDVVVRLTAWGAGTRVDVRSTARTGAGDLGRNASRIRRFLDDLGE